MKRVLTLAIALFAACLAYAAAPAQADVPGHHPRYLHALTDLYQAHALLNHPDEWNVVRDQKKADQEVVEAIRRVRTAARYDGKNLDDHPGVDANTSHRDRLHRALTLLYSARNDVNQREDNSGVRGLRQSAVNDINQAIQWTKRAIANDRWDDHHR